MAQSSDSGVNFLLLSVSERGDPINLNAPGCYVPGVVNNPLPEMSAVDMSLGEVSTKAAAPWAGLSPKLRERMAFFHTQTGVVTHPQIDEVLRLKGAISGLEGGNTREQFPAMFAQEAAPLLGTVLSEPIPLGPVGITANGLPLASIAPNELKDLFSGANVGPAQLASLRDQAVDAMYADLRLNGTQPQRTYLDRHVQSREEARSLGEELGSLLEGISDNPSDLETQVSDQILAAVALFRLAITPVATIMIPFGSDNHQDSLLEEERDGHLLGTRVIDQAWASLVANGLSDKTTFATINVFGRTLERNGAGGRDHNGRHHVMAAFGPRVRAGVYGGLADEDGNGLAAGRIDSSSGRLASEGDIAGAETLLAAVKTVMAWSGLPASVGERRVSGGQIVRGAVT